MKHWYTHDGTKQDGPFTLDELLAQPLHVHTRVWHPGLPGWVEAGSLPELKPFVRPGTPVQLAFKKSPYTPFFWIVLVLALSGLAGWWWYARQDRSATIEEQQQQFAADSIQARSEAERKRRELELQRKNRQYRNRWSSYIKLGTTTPDIDDFWGGVEAFDVPVKNNTEYLLDEVEVAITYIKKNGEVHKTEKVALYNIPPRSIRTTRAPESSRGTSVTVKITRVEAKAFNLCYPKGSGKKGDVFYCP